MSALASFDEKLPQLARVLDTDFMRGMLDAHLQAVGVGRHRYRVGSCVIESARYKPGKSALIGYLCEIENPRDGSVHVTRYAVRLYPLDQSLRRFLKADVTGMEGSPFGPALFHDPMLGAIVWAFPNDGKLRHLSRLIDPTEGNQSLLPSVIRETCGTGWDLVDLKKTLVHYVPEHGCTVRAHLSLKHAARGKRDLLVYGKHYCPGASERAFHTLSALRRCNAVRDGALIVPLPLAHDPDRDMLWTSALPGETLLAGLLRNDLNGHDWNAIGTSIAALHGTPVGDLRCESIERLLSRVDKTCALFERHLPMHAARLSDITRTLRDTAPDPTAMATVTLHGDLHPQNLLIADAQVALIDFDAAATGPALMDLGSFCAALHLHALIHSRDATAAIAPFVEAYRAHVPWTISDRLVAWFTAAALVTERASRCLTRLKPGRTEMIGALLDRATMLVDTARVIRSGWSAHV